MEKINWYFFGNGPFYNSINDKLGDTIFIKNTKYNDPYDQNYLYFVTRYENYFKNRNLIQVTYDIHTNEFIYDTNNTNRKKEDKLVICLSEKINADYITQIDVNNIPNFIFVTIWYGTFKNTMCFILESKFVEYEDQYKKDFKLVENLMIENFNDTIREDNTFKYIILECNNGFSSEDDIDLAKSTIDMSSYESFEVLHRLMTTNNYVSATLKLKNWSMSENGFFKFKFEILEVRNQLEMRPNMLRFKEYINGNCSWCKRSYINNDKSNDNESKQLNVGKELCFDLKWYLFKGIENMNTMDYYVQHIITDDYDTLIYIENEGEYDKKLIKWVNDFFH